MLKKFEKLAERCNILEPGESLIVDKFGKENNRMLIFEKDERFMKGTEIYNNVCIYIYKVKGDLEPGIYKYQNKDIIKDIKIYILPDVLKILWEDS